MNEDHIVFGAGSSFFDGHFPDDPIVPGAALLDVAVACVERRLHCRIARISSAKFPAPLRPDKTAQVRIRRIDTAVQVEVRTEEAVVLLAAFDLDAGEFGQ